MSGTKIIQIRHKAANDTDNSSSISQTSPSNSDTRKNRLLVKKYHTFFAYSKKLSTFALANGNKTVKHGEIAQPVRASDS